MRPNWGSLMPISYLLNYRTTFSQTVFSLSGWYLLNFEAFATTLDTSTWGGASCIKIRLKSSRSLSLVQILDSDCLSHLCWTVEHGYGLGTTRHSDSWCFGVCCQQLKTRGLNPSEYLFMIYILKHWPLCTGTSLVCGVVLLLFGWSKVVVTRAWIVLVEFMYLAFTCMPDDSYRRWFRSLLCPFL